MIAKDARCSIDGCDRKVYSQKAVVGELCRHHYSAWFRFGSASAGIEAMFNALVDQSAGSDSCWLWLGGKTPKGYGVFRSTTVHRLAYRFAYGPIPDGFEIDHKCRIRTCVNPRHLRLATSKQNKENVRGARAHSRSGIRGVHKEGAKWRVRVGHHGKSINVGLFDTAGEAAEAARLKRVELFTHNDLDRLVV